MSNEIARKPNSPLMSWIGWILTVLIGLFMIAGGAYKISIHQGLVPPPPKQEPDIEWPAESMLVLGIVEIACGVLYLLPPSAILGAILLTGYLGGAISAHARVNDLAFFFPALLGVFTWLGIYLRCGRLRALIPFRT